MQLSPSNLHVIRPTSRRSFITTTLGCAASLCVPAISAPVPIQFGSQLYGWGQYYQREGKNFNSHLSEIFSALHDMGYDYAETSLDIAKPETNVKQAELLILKGLKPVSLYSGGTFHETSKAGKAVEQIIAAATHCAKAGFKIINCNPDAIGRNKTAEELGTQARALQTLGEGLETLGLKLGIHHHTPELANEAKEFHSNFQNTPASKVGFCYDVHWVFRGGIKPEAALKDYGSRIVSWHLRQSRRGIWWEDMDTGDIDYGAIARYAKNQLLSPNYTVELALEEGTKLTRNAVDNHRKSLEFVRAIFG